MKLSETPSSSENGIEKLKKMTFQSNQAMLDHLAELGCDISRIQEKNGILMRPASGKPDGLMHILSEVNKDGKVKFDLVSQLLMEDLIAGLKKTPEEWANKTTLTLQKNINSSAIGLIGPSSVPPFRQKTLEQKIEELELGDNEICGILRKKVNNRGWYLDTTEPLIKAKNQEGYKGYVPTIPNRKKLELLINETYQEEDFVIARYRG